VPKPETGPETIEQALTRLENRIIDRFGGNAPGDQQTIAADEKPAEVRKTTASSFTRRSRPLPSSPGWPGVDPNPVDGRFKPSI
jgi:hypothetical protein